MGSECGCLLPNPEIEISLISPYKDSISLDSTKDLGLNFKGYQLDKGHHSKTHKRPKEPPKIRIQKEKTTEFDEYFNQTRYSDILEEVSKSYGKLNLDHPLHDGIPVKFQEELIMEDGSVYNGEWDANWNRHGRGLEISPDGTMYIGYFHKNRRHGFGRLIKLNSYCYEGEFINGSLTNYRVLQCKDLNVLEKPKEIKTAMDYLRKGSHNIN